ncbi:hypothetical protein FHX34_1021479 [Actinoplanes teichomyceticus]|uniref:Uncharacterized protein n=1 Tax=Actinoplanes teichomyceticus TaxID=1867 RepID=A0A561WM25_ACTTI|nr:hypothetical protein FHX34_1021479 [Actinoplanes teichomyceticus]
MQAARRPGVIAANDVGDDTPAGIRRRHAGSRGRRDPPDVVPSHRDRPPAARPRPGGCAARLPWVAGSFPVRRSRWQPARIPPAWHPTSGSAPLRARRSGRDPPGTPPSRSRRPVPARAARRSPRDVSAIPGGTASTSATGATTTAPTNAPRARQPPRPRRPGNARHPPRPRRPAKHSNHPSRERPASTTTTPAARAPPSTTTTTATKAPPSTPTTATANAAASTTTTAAANAAARTMTAPARIASGRHEDLATEDPQKRRHPGHVRPAETRPPQPRTARQRR